MSAVEDARRLLADDRVTEAEAVGAAAMATAPRDAGALHVMGLVRFRQERLDEAAFLLGASAALEETSGVRSDLACVQLAQRQPREAVANLERALFIDPGSSPGWCLLGYAYQALDDAPMALRCFSRAAQLDPANADAHAHLGAMRAAAGEVQPAVAAYRASVAANPRQPEVWNNLGGLLEGQEAVACFEEAVKLRPDYADAHYNRANALRLVDRPEEAVAAYEKVLSLDPGRAEAERNLAVALMEANRPLEAARRYAREGDAHARFSEGLALLVTGFLAEGFELYESRLSVPSIFTPRHEDVPRWTGQSLRGRTILVYDEQGIGDTIQFLRYVRLLADAGARVILEVSATLLELAQTAPGVAKAITRDDEPPRCHFQIPLMSLPRAFGTVLETIPGACPYLSPPPSRTESWVKRLPKADGRRRVGIAWSGRPLFANDRRRSMPIETLWPLLARKDCVFHVLQNEMRAEDATWLAAHPDVRNAGRQFVDMSDAAAVTAMMDVVISVDTSIAHLAGALARPTWVLLPFAPDWRWLMDREDSPWYPTARLFRQREPGGWADVVRRVAAAMDGT